MRTRLILLAAGILTASLISVSAQVYDWTTIAGTVTNSGSADGTNSAAQFNGPGGVAVDTYGILYVADTWNAAIRKVTPVGTNWVTTTIAGAAGYGSAAQFNMPFSIAVDTNGNVYVADRDNDTIRKVTPVGTNWVTTTIAGLATNRGSTDGTNSDARFNGPVGIAVDSPGNVYVGDMYNCTIRKVTPVGTNWVTTTIAGLATNWGSADGTNSDARFDSPDGVAVDTSGNLYVAEYGNSTIRKVAPVGTTNWVTSTIAGSAGHRGSADGTNSAARFYIPMGVAVDSAGNVYVADSYNHTIRKVSAVGTNWVTSTIGGTATNIGSADGIGSDARFHYPMGVAVDTNGNLYVADTYNNTIRLGVPLDVLTISKETANVNFNPAKTNSDSCAVTATFNHDASYNLTNLPVSLDIGGADASFNLDAKGKGRGVGEYGTCKLSYKKNTGPWTFTASLKKGSWATQWQTYGLTNATTNAVSVTLPVTLIIGDGGFHGEKNLLYKAKANKSGSAK